MKQLTEYKRFYVNAFLYTKLTFLQYFPWICARERTHKKNKKSIWINMQ